PDVVDLRRTRVALATFSGHGPVEDHLGRELEREAGRALPRVRVAPGSGTEIRAFERAGEQAFVTFESAVFAGRRYARVAMAPVQPVIAWWLVWRRDSISPARHAFVEAARAVAQERLWKVTSVVGGKPLMIGAEAWTQTA